MANGQGQVFVTQADDPITRLSGILDASQQARMQGEKDRATAALEQDKLENAIRQAEIGKEGTLGAAGIGAESRESIADLGAEVERLNRESSERVAGINANRAASDQSTRDMIELLKIQNAQLRDQNRQALDERRLNTEVDDRNLEELQGNKLEGIAQGVGVDKDIDGQPIVDATVWTAYNSRPRTRSRQIIEGLVERAMEPSFYARSRDQLLRTIQAAIETPQQMFESPTLQGGQSNPSFQDARSYHSGSKEAYNEFRRNIGEYVLQGLQSEEEVAADLAFRREVAEAATALNQQLASERDAAPPEVGPEPGVFAP